VSFWLMMAHVVLITVGYAQQARTGVLTEAWDLVVTYPGMLLATVGAALLIAVVVLSIRAARRALRTQSWHLIHLYAYLGVGLALPHQLWTGQDFVSSPAARAYWWTVYAGALAAVVVFRLGLPLWRSVYHRLEVAATVTEAPGVVSVYLRGRHLDRLPVQAGQFFLWRFLDGPGCTRAHPYTLSAAPGSGLLRITVKDLGDGSARAATLRPGTRVLIEGPYGAMTAARRLRPKVLLMAAGVGITTMRALLEDLIGDVTLLYRRPAHRRGVRCGTGRAGPPTRRPRALPRRAPARPGVLVAAPLRARQRRGRAAVARARRRRTRGLSLRPPQWMDAARTAARDAGVPPGHLHLEEFAW
jgi:ferredoxin-NADP reductase